MRIKKIVLAGIATLAVTGGMFAGASTAHADQTLPTSSACVISYGWAHAPVTTTYTKVVDRAYLAAVPEVSHLEWQWELPDTTHTEYRWSLLTRTDQYRWSELTRSYVPAVPAIEHTEAQYRKVIAHDAITHTESQTTDTSTPPAGDGWDLVGTDTVPGAPETFHTEWKWTRYVVTQEATPAWDEIVKPAWTETIDHPAVTHVVHHDAEYETLVKWTKNGGPGEIWVLQGQDPNQAGSWQKTSDTKQSVVKEAWDETVVDQEAYTETIQHDAVVKHHDAAPEEGYWELSDYRTSAPGQYGGWTRTNDSIQVSNGDGTADVVTYHWQRTVVDKEAGNTIAFGYFAQNPGGAWEATGKTRTVVDTPEVPGYYTNWKWTTYTEWGSSSTPPAATDTVKYDSRYHRYTNWVWTRYTDWQESKTPAATDALTSYGSRYERQVSNQDGQTTTQTSADAPGAGWEKIGDPVTVIDQAAVPEVAEISHWATAEGTVAQPTDAWVIAGDTATVTTSYPDERSADAPGDGWVRVDGSEQQTGDCDTAVDPGTPGENGTDPTDPAPAADPAPADPAPADPAPADPAPADPAPADPAPADLPIATVAQSHTAPVAHAAQPARRAQVAYPTSVEAGLPGTDTRPATRDHGVTTSLAGLALAAAGALALRIGRRRRRA